MGRKHKNGNWREAQPPRPPLLDPETKRGIVALMLFLLAVVILLAFGGLGGKGGALAATALHKVLGMGVLLVPLSLILASLSIFTSIHERFYAPTFIGSGLFLLAFEGILHLFFPEARGGGYAGFVVAEPLRRLVSFWPTLVILTGLIIVSLITAFNIPLRLVFFPQKSARKKEELVYMEDQRKADAAAAEGATAKNISAAEKTAEAKEAAAAEEEKKETPSAFEIKEVGEEEPRLKRRTAEHKPVKAESAYAFPPLDLLEEDTGEPSSGDIKTTATVIRRALATFDIEVEMGEVNVGPTVTQYTLRPASGVKLARITALQNDLALALAAHPIRIEAPIPGRSLVGIEIPNHAIMLVRLRNLLTEETFRKASATGLSIVLGRDVAGAPVYGDLERMPHLLIAGATGSGKSICIHALLMALLYQNAPQALRFILMDPKRVELAHYNGIPHLLTPVITDAVKTVHALRWAVREMEQRYEILSKSATRDIASHNKRVSADERLPYIIIVIDELADIMAAFGRDVEGMIVRLAQMARAVGIHLVVSTQRPSVEVITGLIKANITSRIAFQVASQVDSRTILDMAGAEKLLGRGDMLYLAGDAHKPRRIQSAFVSEKEVDRVCDFVRKHNAGAEFEEAVTEHAPTDISAEDADEFAEDDPLVDDAAKLARETGKASATLLQRYLKIGYARAARILDILESKGVVGPGEGAKPREVFGVAKPAPYRGGDAVDEDYDEKEGDGEEITG